MQADFTPAYGWRVPAMSLVAGCVVWEIAARLARTPFLPSCTATALALIDLLRGGLILPSLSDSLVTLAVGFGISAIAGMAAGIAMARAESVDRFVEPYLHALLAAPGIIYVPLLFTFFGATRATQVGSVVVHAIFVITATTASALRPKQASLVAMATAFGATERQVFWRVRWPAARPLVVSGLRVGVLLAVKGMVNGEMFIAFTGLGAMLRTFGSRFEVDKLLAMIVVITVVALACTSAIDLVARRSARASS